MPFTNSVVDLTPYVGVIIGAAISAVVSLAAALVTNRGHDRRLRIQLFNNEQKTAIAKLHELVNEDSKKVWPWWRKMRDYLNTFEAQAFLPKEEMMWARGLLKKIEDTADKAYPDDAAIDEWQKQVEEEQEEEWVASLDEEQLRHYEMQQFMKKVKKDASSHLVEAVAGLAGHEEGIRSRLPRLHRPRLRRRKSKKPKP